MNDAEARLVLNAVAETDFRLSQWVERLADSEDLELGDDPQLIKAMERDLRDLAKHLRLLGPRFSVSRVPLGKANCYYATIRHFDDVLAMVQEIQEKAYGSKRNTRQCLARLALCSDGLREMWQAIPSTSKAHYRQ